MRKLLLILGAVGVFLIMFVDTKIQPKVEDDSPFMAKVNFTERTLIFMNELTVAEEKEEIVTPENKEKVIVIERYIDSTQTARVTDKGGVEVYVQPLMQIGNQGEAVEDLQKTLNEKGYDIVVDGIFGAETEEAVKAFQVDTEIQVDGIVGIQTWGELLQ